MGLIHSEGFLIIKVSRSKTDYLPQKRSSDDIKLKEYNSSDDATLPQKVTFKYLGTTIYQEGGCRIKVQVHIGRAWDKWRELAEILCDQKVPKRLKVLIYKTVIKPVLLYRTETMPVTDYLSERVSVCQMRMLHCCLGITIEEHKTNKNIRQEAKIMNILKLMRRRRLQWFGYICI